MLANQNHENLSAAAAVCLPFKEFDRINKKIEK